MVLRPVSRLVNYVSRPSRQVQFAHKTLRRGANRGGRGGAVSVEGGVASA